MIYLCGPINGRTDADCKNWREEVKALWGGDVKDPMDRDYRGRELEPGIAKEIVEGDKRDIADCRAVLVYFDKPSVGTAIEVYMAWTWQTPVVVVDVSGKPLSPWLAYHATKIVDSIPAAVDELRRICEIQT